MSPADSQGEGNRGHPREVWDARGRQRFLEEEGREAKSGQKPKQGGERTQGDPIKARRPFREDQDVLDTEMRGGGARIFHLEISSLKWKVKESGPDKSGACGNGPLESTK